MTTKEYVIGDKKFRQAKLSLGQGEHLLALIQDVIIDTATTKTIVKSIASILPQAMALVLYDEGKQRIDTLRMFDEAGQPLKDRIDFFKSEADFEVAVEVVTDFLTFNPVGLLSERFAKMTEQLGGMGEMLTMEKASKDSTPTLPGEIQVNGTQSVAV